MAVSERIGGMLGTPAGANRFASDRSRERTRFTRGGVLLAVGLGGFVDASCCTRSGSGSTCSRARAATPRSTVARLETNTLWDGVFHAAWWVFAVAGVLVLTQAMRTGYRGVARHMLGLVLAGWGVFNLVEAAVDPHSRHLPHEGG